MQKRSSVLTEIGWLAYFILVFVVLVYLLNIFVVPHHFNDKVAAVIAGVFAALAMIFTRARVARRSPR